MMDSSQNHEMSLGQILVEARERHGASLEQVAKELNIQLDKLRALEEDNYDKLFSPVFVRGYIRSYAKLLKIDSEPLVARYNAQCQQEEAPLPQTESLNEKMTVKPPTWPARLLLITVIVVLWALAYWYFGDKPEPSAEAEAGQSLGADKAAVVPAQETADTGDEQAVSSAAMVQPQAVASASSDLSTAVETLARAEQAHSSVAAAADNSRDEIISPDSLQLRFANDCWVDITDATGKKLIAALQKANSELTLTGNSPFDITLGNAEGVDITLNQAPVKIPEAGPGKVVHFTAVAPQ